MDPLPTTRYAMFLDDLTLALSPTLTHVFHRLYLTADLSSSSARRTWPASACCPRTWRWWCPATTPPWTSRWSPLSPWPRACASPCAREARPSAPAWSPRSSSKVLRIDIRAVFWWIVSLSCDLTVAVICSDYAVVWRRAGEENGVFRKGCCILLVFWRSGEFSMFYNRNENKLIVVKPH